MVSINLNLSDVAVLRASALEKSLNAENKADVVARSLALMYYLVEHENLGYDILIHKMGMYQKISIPR